MVHDEVWHVMGMEQAKFVDKVMEKLAKPEVQEALLELIDKLDVVKYVVDQLWEARRSGLIDDLLDLLTTVTFIQRGLLTEGFVAKLSKLQETLLVTANNLSMDPTKVDCLTSAISMAQPERPIGLLGLLSALRDPQVQRGLSYLVAILKQLGSCLERRG